MTYLTISIDEIETATVDTSGRDLVAINVGGNKSRADYADLNVTGGRYDGDGMGDQRIWIYQLPLRIGQVVTVAFVEHGVQTGQGSILQDLYPDSANLAPMSADSLMLEEKEQKAAAGVAEYDVRLTMSSGAGVTLITTPEDHGFGFTALWNRWNPDRVSVSLRAYTLESLAAKKAGRYAAREKMTVGKSVRLELTGSPD